MELKIFANYGVLAHEKTPVYTINPITRDLADEITVVIPDDFKPYTTESGEIAVTLDGIVYLLQQVLVSVNGAPALEWCSGPYRWTKFLAVKA